MECVRESRTEKGAVVVQKRIQMAANKLQYLAARQKAGNDIWCPKTTVPEINFCRFWDNGKQVFVTVKPCKSKKRAREEDQSESRKRPRVRAPRSIVPAHFALPQRATAAPGLVTFTKAAPQRVVPVQPPSCVTFVRSFPTQVVQSQVPEVQLSQQVSSLAQFGLNYQLDIRPVD